MFNTNVTSIFAFFVLLFFISLGLTVEYQQQASIIAWGILFSIILIVLGFAEAHERVNREPIVLPYIHHVVVEEEVCDRLWISAPCGLVETFESLPSGKAWMVIDGETEAWGTLEGINKLAWAQMNRAYGAPRKIIGLDVHDTSLHIDTFIKHGMS